MYKSGSAPLLRKGVGALSRPLSISKWGTSRWGGSSGEVRPEERISNRSSESRSLSTAFPEELLRDDEEDSSRDGSFEVRGSDPSWTEGNAVSLNSFLGPMSAVRGSRAQLLSYPLRQCGPSTSDDHSIPSLPLPTSSSHAAPTSSQFLSWPWALVLCFSKRPGSIGGAESVHKVVQTMDEKN